MRPLFAIPIFYPEHELPKEALGADWLRQMRTEGRSYDAGSTKTMTGRLNLRMTRLNACFLNQRPEIETKEIVLKMLAYSTPAEHLRSEAVPPLWLESLHKVVNENCADPTHVSGLANEAGSRRASRLSNPISCSGRIS